MKRLALYALTACTLVHASSTTLEKKRAIMQQGYQGKKVLVTGGCGFIGSHIAQTLINCGARVTILDDLSTGSIANIKTIQDRVHLIEGSICDMQTCLQATQGQDVIFHLAAFISVPQSVEEPVRCNQINVDGTINILEAARINNVTRLVFSSSSAVYGVPQEACDELAPCNPTSPYGFSKRIGELLCKQYSINYGVGTICLRYFNVYGDRQNPNAQYAAVVAKFRDLMSKDQQITIFGDGKQTRDFVPVEQVAQANLLMGLLPQENMSGDIFNVATGKSISILELFEQLKEEFPTYKHQPKFAPTRAGDVKHTAAICTKLQTTYAELF